MGKHRTTKSTYFNGSQVEITAVNKDIDMLIHIISEFNQIANMADGDLERKNLN